MHAAKPLTVNDHVVTDLAANDPPPPGLARRHGVAQLTRTVRVG